jgi:hypothetical protein
MQAQFRLGWVRFGLISLAAVIGAATGCMDRPVGKLAPETTSLIVDKISQSRVDKIDLLFMVDNSVSMADKQQILQAAVPDLVGRLVNPVCVDSAGNQYPNETAALGPNDECPTVNGQALGREFEPIVNINVGVITSSLGGFGSTSGACDDTPGEDGQKQDMAHLVGSLPRGQLALNGSPAANASGFGFLEWRGGDRAGFETAFSNLVQATGEFGCGFEASLESWYRFLIDPEPYATLTPVTCNAQTTETNCRVPSGIDQEILDQRAAFLRPDSLVAVVMLTDENDCSVKASGRASYVAEVGEDNPMWRAASVCETDPNNACCYSCGQLPPTGCSPDPVCGAADNTGEVGDYYLDAQQRKSSEDPDNLRCFHQKQRFGVDFLYPTERYSNALSQPELCLTRNDLSAADCGGGRVVPNPLYTIPEGATVTLSRDPSLVFLAGIVGVPWQDIARNKDEAQPLEYKTFTQLSDENVWSTILGDGVKPGDPLMEESITARSGESPMVEEALAPPSGGHLANSVNGHEWEPNPPSDLQYACIFPLVEPRDCAALEAADDPRHCDCQGSADTAESQLSKPLCQNPEGGYGRKQYYAKAYPGIRELQVLQEYGDATTNSIVASICARNVHDTAAQDYGYRPAIGAIVDRLKDVLGDRCLPRPLALDSEGNVPCSVVEARPKASVTDTCQACGEITAREDVNPQAMPLLHEKMRQNGMCQGAACETNFCLCEVSPTRRSGRGPDDPPNLDAEHDCQNTESPADSTDGWCYVDQTGALTLGNPELVAQCPSTSKRKLRFVGDGQLAQGSTTFVACLGASLTEATSKE